VCLVNIAFVIRSACGPDIDRNKLNILVVDFLDDQARKMAPVVHRELDDSQRS